jgi:hypothetical protein
LRAPNRAGASSVSQHELGAIEGVPAEHLDRELRPAVAVGITRDVGVAIRQVVDVQFARHLVEALGADEGERLVAPDEGVGVDVRQVNPVGLHLVQTPEMGVHEVDDGVAVGFCGGVEHVGVGTVAADQDVLAALAVDPVAYGGRPP